MGTGFVSILTPTYNHERYVEQCIESVLAQTYSHWEQIVVDDGSSDGTAEIVRQIHDNRVNLVVQPHRGIFGLAETYNTALRQARGDLIAILEGDDFWPPDKLATLVPAFVDPGVILAFGQTLETTSDGRPTGFTIPSRKFVKEFENAALLNTPVGAATKVMFYKPRVTYTFPCSVVIRRSALEAIGGFQHIDGVPFVDYQTFLTLSLIGRYFYTPKVMGFWRRHGSSATALRYQDLTEMRLLAFMRRFLDRNRSLLALTQEEEETIDNVLQEWERRIALYHGLAALRTGQWAEARGRFRIALGSRQPIIVFAGLASIIASYLHTDLEWLVAILARLVDRQRRVTGVRRRLSEDVGSHSDSAEVR